ncbi:MAG: hypothetical protein M1826_000013 [Phylliscum demangeonii]|nr:MAG: hypothetical protein M1826_000013 [Phylliscum demangeonii]
MVSLLAMAVLATGSLLHTLSALLRTPLLSALPALLAIIAAHHSPGARGYQPLSNSSLAALRAPTAAEFDITTGRLLAPILQPRVPGTAGSRAVLEHFVAFFRAELPAWTLTFQNSSARTPATGAGASAGPVVPFVNLIARRDPPGAVDGDLGRLTLVAHYDSKREPAGFVGATDSAAPCAIILHAATAVEAALARKWAATKTTEAAGGERALLDEPDQGVQILLLDGEEAFASWTNEDSLYGARSLAQEWERSPHAARSTYRDPLAAITLFVLLDLLGAPEPQVPSYFRTTHWAYAHLARLEARLRALHLFRSGPPHHHPFLTSPHADANAHDANDIHAPAVMVLDDHLPFMQRGVDILHLIPTPFPDVWHTPLDDGAHLDLDTVCDWARLLAAFVAEWFELEPWVRVGRVPVEGEALALALGLGKGKGNGVEGQSKAAETAEPSVLASASAAKGTGTGRERRSAEGEGGGGGGGGGGSGTGTGNEGRVISKTEL